MSKLLKNLFQKDFQRLILKMSKIFKKFIIGNESV